jgi:glycosyltransferase involved in cell wall biosynthesis
VSVVIATRNRRLMLGEAIGSVRSQSGVDWELIVVDDGSTDDTKEWLELTLDGPRERQLSRAHGGRSEAANAGLAAARGRYVLFLDDDDLLQRGALEGLARALRAHPEATLAMGARLRMHRGEVNRMNHPARELVRDASLDLLAWWGAVPGQFMMPAEVVRAVGGFPADAWPTDDRALLMLLASRGPFVLVPQAVVFYRTHPGQHVRPPGMGAIYAKLVAQAIARLAPERRRAGQAAWVAGQRFERAKATLRAGHPARALPLYAAAFLTSPRVCCSPVIWPLMVYDVRTACRQLLARRA